MQETRAFYPLYSNGTLLPSVTLAATDTAQATPRFSGVDQNSFAQMRIANLSTSWAYVNFGVFGNVTAATVAASLPLAPSAVTIVSVDPLVTGASVILGTAAATGNVIFTRGGGIA